VAFSVVHANVMDNAVVVISHRRGHHDYLLEYERMNIPFGVLHMADEAYLADTRFYNLSVSGRGCDGVDPTCGFSRPKVVMSFHLL
jgi:hypothetical protein